MALQAIVNQPGLFCIVLEEYEGLGVYVLAYDCADNYPHNPCQDHLQNDWQTAKICAKELFGVLEVDLKKVPDTHFDG